MEPAPPPTDSPHAQDEPELVRTPLTDGTTRRGVELRSVLNALSLLLAAVLLVVAAGFGLQRLRPQSATKGSTPTPTISTPTRPPTPAPTIAPGQGWTHTGPPWAQGIIFAPSDPRTAYICGTPTNNDQNRQAPVALGISLDRGHTWQTRATSILASYCQVDVDPTTTQDLVLRVESCLPCATPLLAQLYRSLDGGRSWHLVTLPPPAGTSSMTFTAYWWAWQGSALFVQPSGAGTQGRPLIALSVSGGSFTWVNERALGAGVPAGMRLNDIYANADAVYADFLYEPGDCSQNCNLTKTSGDLGATWSVFQPQYQGHAVFLLDQTVSIADGQTLIGQSFPSGDENSRLYVRSTDGGATWTPLPSPPGDLIITTLASTPSGIFYAETWSFGIATAPPAVYRLTPGWKIGGRAGASAWSLAGALPSSGSAVVASWDDQGQPLALWSGAAPFSAQEITAGLATHAP